MLKDARALWHKAFSIALALVLAAGFFPQAAAADTPDDGGKFTIAIIPDSQNEVSSIELIEAGFSENRTRWLAENKEELNLRFVIHTGDMMNWPERDPNQAPIASAAMKILDDANIPYLIAPGNHDTGATGVGGSAYDVSRTNQLVRVTDQLNKYFTHERLPYAVSFEPDKIENSYATFEAGGRKWMVIVFELWPRTEVIDWAKDAVAAHPDHNVILATHSYLTSDLKIYENKDYGANSPKYLFDNLVKQYPNIRMVFCGHTGLAGSRVDYGVHGNKIITILSTFHSGKNNPVQLMEIDTSENTARNRFYAPLDGFEWPQFAEEFINMNFVRPFDRVALTELIDESLTVQDEKSYTPESWNNFRSKLDMAISVRDNAESSDRQVYDAVLSLSNAKEELLKIITFKDVPEGAWYFNAVSFITGKRFASGTGGGNFSPDLRLKRADCLVMLLKACDIPPDVGALNNFYDAGDTYYTDYLAAAKRLKITSGVGDNMFEPEREISRQEVFVLIYNTLKNLRKLPKGDTGRELSGFADADKVQPWAREAVEYFVRIGVISGNAAGELKPEGMITRAEMAQVLYNLLKPY